MASQHTRTATTKRVSGLGEKELADHMKLIATELHKPSLKKFPTRRVLAFAVDDIWSSDLLDMGGPAHNNGYRYIVVVVDVYSRFASGIPICKKTADEVLTAIETVGEEHGTLPKKLWTDQGKEYYNTKMSSFLKKNEVGQYSTFGPHKASIAESFNRTLRIMLQKRMTELNTLNWVDLLPEVLEGYNKRIHSTIHKSPVDVYSGRETPINPVEREHTFHKLSPGDVVRISRTKSVFEKEADHPWTRELFRIIENKPTNPPTYKLEDLAEDPIIGSFYEQEVQQSKQRLDIDLIDQVLVKRGKKALVSWLGYPPKFNSWITL